MRSKSSNKVLAAEGGRVALDDNDNDDDDVIIDDELAVGLPPLPPPLLLLFAWSASRAAVSTAAKNLCKCSDWSTNRGRYCSALATAAAAANSASLPVAVAAGPAGLVGLVLVLASVVDWKEPVQRSINRWVVWSGKAANNGRP